MKKFLLHALRIISYIVLPIGTYIAAGVGIPSINNILNPIMPTNPAEEIAVIVVLGVLPILIILFLRPQKEPQTLVNTQAVSKSFFRVIERPTPKSLLINLVAIIVLIIIGLLPLIFGSIILLMFMQAAAR